MNGFSNATESELDAKDTNAGANQAAPVRHSRLARLTAGAIVGITCSVMYQLLQQFPAHTAHLRTDCWSWQQIPFSEIWLWPYLSMFAIVGCAWLALPNKHSTRRFIICFLGTGLVAWICFYFWPTSCLRPPPESLSMPYRLLVLFDAPSNCLPCLHSAFAILSAVVLYRRISQMQHATALRVLLIIWVTLINLSIVGLRQHTGIDVAAGLLLGGCASWIHSSRSAGAD